MKNRSQYTQLLHQVEGKSFFSDTFHQRTNNKSLKTNDDPKDWPESWKKISYKTYPRLDKITLVSSASDKLTILIRNRRSIRKFTKEALSLRNLSYLLYSSSGLIHSDGNYDNIRRPYPSAGGRYPLEVYPIVLNVKELEQGLYHYNVRDSTVELLLKENLSTWIYKVFGRQDWLLQASLIIIITGVLDRSRIKYRDRGYRFALIESGHLRQNICLFATKLGLGTCSLGGYIDTEVDKLLDLQHTNERTLYTIAVGSL